MSNKHFIQQQEFLDQVAKPSRYLGTEINAVSKDPAHVAVHLVLAFPDLYEIGTSHFGLQILYHLLNQQQHIQAERVFAPARDLETQLRGRGLALSSLESGTALNHFDIIGFSLLYELNYTNVLNMLDLGRVPLFSKERSSEHPFVIAGGPCVCNPEPMADFFDAMVYGDGEEVVLEMVSLWQSWKNKHGTERQDLLKQWAQLEGVYIPSLFEPAYDREGFQYLKPLLAQHVSIRRRIVADLDQAFFPDRPIVPFSRPVHDRLRLEISRGCTRGCRFCQAGMIYRPVRERSPETLLDLCRTGLSATGYEDLSLLSLSTGDYTCLNGLMENLMAVCQSDRVAVSLPSIRAGTLNPRLMELIKQVRKTGFTIAPEAGSQRLRDVINKNICLEDISVTVQDAFSLGWRLIKLYFMIGLPTETQDDLDAIVEMVHYLKRIKGAGHRSGRLNVSITSFIPKPHTPFQWASQISQSESMHILEDFRSRLQKSGVQLKWQNPAMSILEGCMSRGDRRLARVIWKAWHSGCKFDGWSDQFNFALWEKAFASIDLSMDHYTSRVRTLNEPLPWRHMESLVSEDFLKQQWQAALSAETLTDCRHDKCHDCGVCNFSTIAPVTFPCCKPVAMAPPTPGRQPVIGKLPEKVMEFNYSKLNQARFFGHLEVANIFARALRRSGIKVRYSGGFHPMPRISFDDPLPLGMESESENMRIALAIETDDRLMIEALNSQLPSGLKITSCRLFKKGSPLLAVQEDAYRIQFSPRTLDAEMADAFFSAPQWLYEKNRSNGKSRQIDFTTVIKYLGFPTPGTMQLVIFRNKQVTVRPMDVLIGIFNVSPDRIFQFRVTKMHRTDTGLFNREAGS